MTGEKIVFAEISDALSIITDDLLGLVPSERREKIKKFRFNIDRKLSLYSELLVRYQICKKLNIPNKDIKFEKNEYGKPFVLNYPEFNFNISHTRNAMVVAFSDNKIGVDVESVKALDSKIVNRFFTSREQSYIFTHSNPNYGFYEVWTKKEAYIKYTGTGLFAPLDSFDVFENGISSVLHTFTMKEYIVSVCCDKKLTTEPEITDLTETELLILADTLSE